MPQPPDPIAADCMSTVLITGAASGLGQSFFNHYINSTDPQWKVVAVDRDAMPSIPEDLKSRVSCFQADLASHKSTEALHSALSKVPIDLIIHSAGIRGLAPSIEKEYPGDVARAETIEAMDEATLLRTFHINTVGTFNLIKSLLPNLQEAAKRSASGKPKVTVMGSRMGSMSYNTAGGGYAYRASKAALNAVVKSMSIDVPEVIFAIVHPGRVETKLVKSREEGAMEPEESLKDMLTLIGGLKSENSGCYVDRFGKDIGW